ncbi:MAG: hypothetical protein EOO25_09535 [Comamonadaceae bacterium]|nr:MAG: hypothetical protein EOO25_09535 [Comamonadaceae bacterium]
MQFEIARRPDFVDVTVTGPIEVQPLLHLIQRLGDFTRESGDTRLMFDLLGMEGEVPFTGQIQTGEQVVLSMGHLQRIASVVPRDRLTRTSEKVARAQGVQLQIFVSRPAAVEWLLDDAALAPDPAAQDVVRLSPAHEAIWDATRHLFPPNAQAIQLPNGTLAISWPLDGSSEAVHEMAAPVTVRLEPDLLHHLQRADDDQRERIAVQQEAVLRAGLMGYEPLTPVPQARVIVLG